MMLTITTADRDEAPESFSFHVLSILYDRRNMVTEHPIEQLANVSDHIERQLDGYRFRCIVTETPLQADAPRPTSQSRILDAENFLERAAPGANVLQVAGRPTVPSVTLLQWPWELDMYRRAVFTFGFRELRIARGVTVRIPVRAAPDTSGVPSEQDLGEQAGEEDASIFYNAFGPAVSSFGLVPGTDGSGNILGDSLVPGTDEFGNIITP